MFKTEPLKSFVIGKCKRIPIPSRQFIHSLSSQTFHFPSHLSVNIPAKDRLVIPFGSSPFLKNPLEMPAIDSIDPCLAKTPNPPLEPPTLPGDTIFGYLPPHPAHSNPKKNRRYLLTVMEQSSKINADELKLAIKAKVAEAAAEAEKSVSSSSAPEGFSIVAQGLVQRENELEFKERSVALPTWKFVKDNQLKVVGYGFFKSTWNLLTPPIYNALGKEVGEGGIQTNKILLLILCFPPLPLTRYSRTSLWKSAAK